MASSLSLDVGIFFGRFQHFFVNDCSAVSCDLGVFIRRAELMSFYSAILSEIFPRGFDKVVNDSLQMVS